MISKSSGFIFTFALMFSFGAKAEDLSGRWGLGLGGGMSTIVGSKSSKDALDGDLTGSFWGRYHMNQRFGVELAYSRLYFDFKNSLLNALAPTADSVDLSVAYRAWPQSRVHFLVQLGLGYGRLTEVRSARPMEEVDELMLKARLGVEYMLKPNWMLAVHADTYRLRGDNSNIIAVSPMLALTYYPQFTPSNVDPNVPPPAKGVSGDTDADGIPDSIDKCPHSTAGGAVNEFGCAVGEKVEFTLNVKFALGSEKIDEEFVSDMDRLAEFLQQYPKVKAEIEGHTDNRGSEKFNFKISQKRAEAVRSYLIRKHKISSGRLKAKGYGPSQPIADNDSEKGRAKNRRVVVHVLAQ